MLYDFLCKYRAANPNPAKPFCMCCQQELHTCIRCRLSGNDPLCHSSAFIWIAIHFGHIHAQEYDDRRIGDSFTGTLQPFLDFISRKLVLFEVALKLRRH